MKKDQKKRIQIAAGVATKFKKVRFEVPEIVAMHKAGKRVAEIASAIGYPPNTGNNRVRNLLTKCGLINASARKKSRKKAAA
jgi:predicted transcriptional regulator